MIINVGIAILAKREKEYGPTWVNQECLDDYLGFYSACGCCFQLFLFGWMLCNDGLLDNSFKLI